MSEHFWGRLYPRNRHLKCEEAHVPLLKIYELSGENKGFDKVTYVTSVYQEVPCCDLLDQSWWGEGWGQGALRQTNAEKPRPGFSVVVLAGHRALKLPSRARSCLWRQAERVLLYQGHLSVSVWGAMSGPAGKKEGWEDERELEEKSLCFTGRKKKKKVKDGEWQVGCHESCRWGAVSPVRAWRTSSEVLAVFLSFFASWQRPRCSSHRVKNYGCPEPNPARGNWKWTSYQCKGNGWREN